MFCFFACAPFYAAQIINRSVAGSQPLVHNVQINQGFFPWDQSPDFFYADFAKIASTISPDLTERMDKRVSLSCKLSN